MLILDFLCLFISLFVCLFVFSEHSGTKFTEEPPSIVFVNLYSDLIFHWKFAFGDDYDFSNFNEIVWGRTNNDKYIADKYITVHKYNNYTINYQQSNTFQTRLDVTGNITQNECNVKFVLKNVTRSDESSTYGCEADVDGQEFRSGPIRLVIQGKLHVRSFIL